MLLNTSTETPRQSDNGGSYWASNRQDTLDKGMIHDWIGWARPLEISEPIFFFFPGVGWRQEYWSGLPFPSPGPHEISSQTQNMAQFTTSVLFISGTFHLIFLDCDWPWVTETSESRTRDEVGSAVSHFSLMTALWGRDCYSHLTEDTMEARGG